MRQVWVSEADYAIFDTELEAQRHELSAWLRQQSEAQVQLQEAGWTRDSGGLELAEATAVFLRLWLDLIPKIKRAQERLVELERKP